MFSIHDLPQYRLKPRSFLIGNLDYPQNGGTHWVLLYSQPNELIYFDSFGVEPGKSVQNYSKKYDYIVYQTEDIQALDSSVCGFFCLYVADELSKGSTFKDIMSRFTLDPSKQNFDVLRKHFT